MTFTLKNINAGIVVPWSQMTGIIRKITLKADITDIRFSDLDGFRHQLCAEHEASF